MTVHRSAYSAARAPAEVRPSAAPLSVRLKLPWPPSVNHYWGEKIVRSKTTGQMIMLRFIRERGRLYRVQVSEAVMVQRVPRRQLTGRLAIYVIAKPPDRRTRDLDNLWKCTLDSLKHADVIVDDGHFDDLRIIRGPVVPNGELEVVIDEIPGEPMTSESLFREFEIDDRIKSGGQNGRKNSVEAST